MHWSMDQVEIWSLLCSPLQPLCIVQQAPPTGRKKWVKRVVSSGQRAIPRSPSMTAGHAWISAGVWPQRGSGGSPAAAAAVQRWLGVTSLLQTSGLRLITRCASRPVAWTISGTTWQQSRSFVRTPFTCMSQTSNTRYQLLFVYKTFTMDHGSDLTRSITSASDSSDRPIIAKSSAVNRRQLNIMYHDQQKNTRLYLKCKCRYALLWRHPRRLHYSLQPMPVRPSVCMSCYGKLVKS